MTSARGQETGVRRRKRYRRLVERVVEILTRSESGASFESLKIMASANV
jgi:hypothetical protein